MPLTKVSTPLNCLVRLDILPFFSVNVLKGKTWNDDSEFDAAKDKAKFRQYEDACDRVKLFYKAQHGMLEYHIKHTARIF
jgi:hypothetical protein